MIEGPLRSLLAQDYPGRAGVIVIDDRSSDGTAATAKAVAVAQAVAAAQAVLPAVPGLPLQVVDGADPPPGWAGKPWALHQGVVAAKAGTFIPEYLLLSDADIVHPPDSLRRLVAAAIAGDRDLVSLMARLRTATGWERLLVPAFVYFFTQLYPFRRVADPSAPTAAAAGGCVLVRTAALDAAGGVATIAGERIDDVALARAVQDAGGSLWLGLADDVASVRPYPALRDLWAMVARSAATQLGHSRVALAATLAGLAALYLGPVALVVGGVASGGAGAAPAGAAAWAAMITTYVPMVRYYRLPLPWAATLPFTAVLDGARTAGSVRHHRGGGPAWKGRRPPATA